MIDIFIKDLKVGKNQKNTLIDEYQLSVIKKYELLKSSKIKMLSHIKEYKDLSLSLK